MRTRLTGAMALVLVVAALGAEAQAVRKPPRIGVLAWEACPGRQSVFAAALRELGYVWGETIDVVCRSADGDHQRLAEAAATLAAENVTLIAALTHVTAFAARRATTSIPIVMIASGDPVRTGLVASLARPGGNVTGLTYYATDLVEKRLQLLKEIVPQATRVAVLDNPDSAHVFGLYGQDAERAAGAVGVRLLRTDARQPGDLATSLETAARDGAQALLVLTDPMLSAQARRISDLAARHRLPAMHWAPWFAEAGGLAAYAADYDAMVRRAAFYVDRILKGVRPGDLPVEQPTRFQLIVNRKAARDLGLSIPPAVLARADRIIE
jgi:putative tryptophan/tyrosine transport system substrate-binding protein